VPAAVGVVPEGVVGLYLDRGVLLLAALVGVLRAGGAYVPLAHPPVHQWGPPVPWHGEPFD